MLKMNVIFIFNYIGIRTIFMCDHNFLVFFGGEMNGNLCICILFDFLKKFRVILLMQNYEVFYKIHALL